MHAGDLTIHVSVDPLTIRIDEQDRRRVQQLRIDSQTGVMTFALGDGPLLGLGEGGPQFDRRGSADRMRSGQGGYQLRTHGGRVPVPWLIGASGWAMFVHHPFGTFDLRGTDGRFEPVDPALASVSAMNGATVEPPQLMAIEDVGCAADWRELARAVGPESVTPREA